MRVTRSGDDQPRVRQNVRGLAQSVRSTTQQNALAIAWQHECQGMAAVAHRLYLRRGVRSASRAFGCALVTGMGWDRGYCAYMAVTPVRLVEIVATLRPPYTVGKWLESGMA